jgi:NAD-reducing hydrogenase large subunit
MHMGQLTQSHALSFFHLSAPDLLLGFDSDPRQRNVIGLIAQQPDIARRGIRLRQYGQQVIQLVGGRKIHPDFPVPGGVNQAFSAAARDQLLAGLPEAMDSARFAFELLRRYEDQHRSEVETFGRFDSNYLGLVQPDGALEHYDGNLRFAGADGAILHDQVPPERYLDFIAEATEPWSYLKFPFLKSRGYPAGLYRVGPLARLNLVTRLPTPQADALWREWRAAGGGVRSSSFYYHSARLIEILYALERIEQLLHEPELLDTDIQVTADPCRPEGIGVIEAPRGTLIHHYWADEHGRIEKVNLIVATGHNNLAMNRGVLEVARQYVKARELREGMLNRVEAVIRCYDPCLSCSTHAVGQMPLLVELRDAEGRVLKTLRRDG